MWIRDSYLDGRSPDPRYTIQRHELAPPFLADRARQLPYETVAALDPFAFDVIDLDFSGPATITFAGDTVAPLLDPPPDGGPVWFAPPADSSRAQLTAAVDLSGDAAASFSFLVWHDLEPVSYTHLDVYKRQDPLRVCRPRLRQHEQFRRKRERPRAMM